MRKIFTAPIAALITGLAVLILAGSCQPAKKSSLFQEPTIPEEPNPRNYICYLSSEPITVDGILNESSWLNVPWTDPFIDIEGISKPKPRFMTRAKMIWDKENLFIAAQLEEPHLWARLKQRDTVIFYDHDFEVFIDPDGDTHAYYELEVNALGTAWDLLLLKPYRDGGPPVNSWDIKGLEVGVHLDGSLNNPADLDSGWTVEIKIPLEILKECAPGARIPAAGEQWRINFSRVEWRTKIENNSYVKEINPETGKPFPEDNWVWSPQGRINMHMPEMWGIIQFSDKTAGMGTDEWVADLTLPTKWALRKVYYYQSGYLLANQKYAKTLAELGLDGSDFPGTGLPDMEAGTRTFEAWLPMPGSQYPIGIRDDGKLFVRGPVSN